MMLNNLMHVNLWKFIVKNICICDQEKERGSGVKKKGQRSKKKGQRSKKKGQR